MNDVYEQIDIEQYRFIFTINNGIIKNVDISKTGYYLGEETDYVDILTSNPNRFYNADGLRRSGSIFNRIMVIPTNIYTDDEIMDVNNLEAIASPVGMKLYYDKSDINDTVITYLSMLLYDYATIRGYYNSYTKYIIDKRFPQKDLNWNLD